MATFIIDNVTEGECNLIKNQPVKHGYASGDGGLRIVGCNQVVSRLFRQGLCGIRLEDDKTRTPCIYCQDRLVVRQTLNKGDRVKS